MEFAATHKAFSGENSWGKSKSPFREERGADVFLFIVPACSWTKASGRYQPVIYFFGVISIFRTPLSSLFVPHASGHRCLLLSSYFSRRDQPRPGGSSPRSERRVSFFHPQSRRKTFRARPLQTDKLEGRGVRRMWTLFHVNCKERNHRPSASVQVLDAG